jgi:hypothetical protein
MTIAPPAVVDRIQHNSWSFDREFLAVRLGAMDGRGLHHWLAIETYAAVGYYPRL